MDWFVVFYLIILPAFVLMVVLWAIIGGVTRIIRWWDRAHREPRTQPLEAVSPPAPMTGLTTDEQAMLASLATRPVVREDAALARGEVLAEESEEQR